MDMYQNRKMKSAKKNNGSQESFSNVSISWYKPTLINFQANLYFIRLFI